MHRFDDAFGRSLARTVTLPQNSHIWKKAFSGEQLLLLLHIQNTSLSPTCQCRLHAIRLIDSEMWTPVRDTRLGLLSDANKAITRKPSCRWQTRATLAKSLHGLRKSSGVVSCIASLPIDSVPMVSYYVLYNNCVCKMRWFGDTRLLKLP